MFWWNQPKMDWQEFKESYPVDSQRYNDLFRKFNFYNMLGLLSRGGFIDPELVDQSFALLWDKYKPIIVGAREDIGMSQLYEDYEWLAETRKN